MLQSLGSLPVGADALSGGLASPFGGGIHGQHDDEHRNSRQPNNDDQVLEVLVDGVDAEHQCQKAEDSDTEQGATLGHPAKHIGPREDDHDEQRHGGQCHQASLVGRQIAEDASDRIANEFEHDNSNLEVRF